MEPFKITNEGLKELPRDDRDFSLGGVYGFIDIKDVPTTDFIVTEPLVIKDQGDTDYCSAYAVTAVSEDQEKIELSTEYQFYSTKRISGNKESWGADLRDACKSAVTYGSIPKIKALDMVDKPRSYILEEKNWHPFIDQLAKIYSKSTFFKVTGQYDLFDNIRCALWQHKEDRSTIVTGALWKRGWINAVNGIIPDISGDGFGHAFKIFGQAIRNGELCLVAQLSSSNQIGDGGLYYFNREIANRELGRYGMFMFKDISREEAEFYLSKPYTLNSNWFQKILSIIINFFKKI